VCVKVIFWIPVIFSYRISLTCRLPSLILATHGGRVSVFTSLAGTVATKQYSTGQMDFRLRYKGLGETRELYPQLSLRTGR
jgi:hypothetical protein